MSFTPSPVTSPTWRKRTFFRADLIFNRYFLKSDSMLSTGGTEKVIRLRMSGFLEIVRSP